MGAFRSGWQRCAGATLAMLAVFVVVGGHLAVIQSIAWAGMLRDYTVEEGSIAAGVRKTFGGSAPCALCKKVADARQQEERKAPILKTEKKAEIVLAARAVVPAARRAGDFSYFPPDDNRAVARSDAPPDPIPIASVS